MATDSLQIFGTSYTGVTGIKATDSSNGTKTYIRPQGTKSISVNGTGIDVTEYAAVDVNIPTGIDCPAFTVTFDQNYEEIISITCDKTYSECDAYIDNANFNASIGGLNIPTVMGNACDATSTTLVYAFDWNQDKIADILVTISSNNTITWVEDPIPSRTSSDLTSSNLTVTAPAGYYASAATKTLTDSNLVAGNIKSGTTIFGVTGSYTGAGVSLQYKQNINPTESSRTITPDEGYDGLSSVQINGISTTYVGSGIARKSSSDLTASGATVTVPAGYYASQATKSVSSGSATGPSSLSGSSATVSTGTNTITLTKTGVTTTPTVSAGYVSSATASTATVTLTASVTTKAAATITPGTSNQTIASGTYLTGTQTISGDADLVASNIISTANIFGVQGSVVINKYYTGTSAPSSSLGSNGDIYIQQEVQ